MDFSHHPFHIPVKGTISQAVQHLFPPVKVEEWIAEEKETFVWVCGLVIHTRISYLSLLQFTSQGLF